MQRFGPRAIGAALLTAALLLPAALLACPACSDAVDGGASGGSVARGFARSIYFMLVSFFTLLAFVITLIVRTSKRQTALLGESEPAS